MPPPAASPARTAQPLDKVIASLDEAVDGIGDDVTVMVGGFGGAGFPTALRDALIRRRPRRITVICNNADFGGFVYEDGIVRMICSYPVGATSKPLLAAIEEGRVDLQLTPQGTLVERIRAGGAGLGGFLTPTGLGTEFEKGFTRVEVDGTPYLLVPPLHADFALIRADVADRYGNLVHRHAGRNFNPPMATAARVTIAEVARIVEPGEIDPNHVHVPAAFVDRVVQVG
jgi:3-oxoadipate CoA-transferase, alpha subunit